MHLIILSLLSLVLHQQRLDTKSMQAYHLVWPHISINTHPQVSCSV